MEIKEEILKKIRGVQATLNSTVYPLMSDLDETSNGLFFDVLEFIQRVEKNYPEQYEANGLEYHFDDIISFGWAYLKTFKPFPFQLTLDSDGILPIGLPINEMITHFYEYVINLQGDSPALQPVQAAFDMSVITAMADQIKVLAGMASTIEQVSNVQAETAIKVTELHTVQTGKLYKPKKTLTRKEIKAKEEAEFQEERRQIHLSWLNGK